MLNQQLREYCAAEFENIETVLSELHFVIRPGKADYSVAELAAMATFVHNCYNGVENILKRVLLSQQTAIKDSPTWHKELLKTSFDKGIVSEELYEILSNYLSFRHFFIHAYSFNVRWEELRPLVEKLENTIMEFKSAINAIL